MEKSNNPNGKRAVKFSYIAIILILICLFSIFTNSDNKIKFDKSDNTFKIIASSENKDLENIITEFAEEKNMDSSIEYAGTLDIMEKLNSGEKYDAIWASNSIWLYMLDNSIKLSNSKSTSINPVVFGVKKSKAESLGFIGKDIYTKDIVLSGFFQFHW